MLRASKGLLGSRQAQSADLILRSLARPVLSLTTLIDEHAYEGR